MGVSVQRVGTNFGFVQLSLLTVFCRQVLHRAHNRHGFIKYERPNIRLLHVRPSLALSKVSFKSRCVDGYLVGNSSALTDLAQ